MLPAMLSTLVEYLDANPGVQMVYADEELIGETGQPLRNRRFYWDYQTPRGSGIIHLPHDTGELNYNHNNYIGACFLYRAWTAKILGPYDPACFGFEDYDYWLRMNALFRIAHRGVAGPLYQYRLHPASLTSRAAELRILHRSRQHISLEKDRRRFFLEPFDITFAGHHPYFTPLACAYRDCGHNVHPAAVGERAPLTKSPAPIARPSSSPPAPSIGRRSQPDKEYSTLSLRKIAFAFPRPGSPCHRPSPSPIRSSPPRTPRSGPLRRWSVIPVAHSAVRLLGLGLFVARLLADHENRERIRHHLAAGDRPSGRRRRGGRSDTRRRSAGCGSSCCPASASSRSSSSSRSARPRSWWDCSP